MQNMSITPEDFQTSRVTLPGQAEIVKDRLYDHQLLSGTGSTQLSFFQQQVGTGVTTAVGATATTLKTQFDTNMTLAGQLPSGFSFLIDSIEVLFWAGSVSTANTFTIAQAGFFAAVAAVTVTEPAVDDAVFFYASGMLELNILAKNYVRQAPLAAFPPKAYPGTSGAIASNSATTAQVGFAVTKGEGRPYYLEPRISIQPAVNFEVLLKWPNAVALPSGFNARVGVVLDGYSMRAAQ